MDAHQNLLSGWRGLPRHQRATFVDDGAIDERLWGTSKKVLFLLKEAYGESPEGGSWDLRTAIRDEWRGPKYSIWHTAAALAYLCQRATASSKPPYPEPGGVDLSQALLASAAVNIKKSSGRSASDDDELLAYAKEDGALIREQLRLLAPDLVICGGTWKFRSAIGLDARQVGRRLWRGADTYFVDFWHPAYQVPREMMYDALWGIHAETPFL